MFELGIISTILTNGAKIIPWIYNKKPRLTLTVSKYFFIDRPKQNMLCFELTIVNDSNRNLYGKEIEYECETKEQPFFSVPLSYDEFILLYLKGKYHSSANIMDKNGIIKCSNKEPYVFFFSTNFEQKMESITHIKLKYKDEYGKAQSLIGNVPLRSRLVISKEYEHYILKTPTPP